MLTDQEDNTVGEFKKGAFSFFQQRPSIGDVIGGVSVALILIPQAIAYADIAGLPPTSGLIAATLPLIFGAAFVSCPWLQTGPTAMTSLFTLGALASLDSVTPSVAVTVASMLALVVGLTRLIMGLLKAGQLIKYLKEPVILGFTSAAAILIVASQLGNLVGLESNEPVMKRAISALSMPDVWSIDAIVMSVLCVAIILQCRKFHRLFPGILLATAAAIFISTFTGYQGPIVGEIAKNSLTFNFDFPWKHMPTILFSGIVIAVVGFAEPASISLALTREAGIRWNASRELLGSGVANLTSALIGGYPIGGSFSRTSVNQIAGSTTSWSGLITGAIVLCFLPLVGLLQYMPRAALAAIIVLAVLRLIKVREIYDLLRKQPAWGAVALATLIATLIAAPNIEYGIVFGVVLSLVVGHIKKRPPSLS